MAESWVNGNISGVRWDYGSVTNTFKYSYDVLNRYTSSTMYSTDPALKGLQNYETFDYDKHGNIIALYRGNKYTPYVDNLQGDNITYLGNKLHCINDIGENQNRHDVKEYQDLHNSTVDYWEADFRYDKNGNMTADLDRDIVAIRYNLLNLPDTIQFRLEGNQIINRYDASGTKLSTEYITSNSSTLLPVGKITTNYAGMGISRIGIAYNQHLEYQLTGGVTANISVPYRIHNPEGYTAPLSARFLKYYYRRDHLGNVREVWTPDITGYSATTVQRMQYYPSGLPMPECYQANHQPYKYNGKEFVDFHGYDSYDYGARHYYPAFPVLPTVDPLEEKYPWCSPYNYCSNNPVNRIDTDGMDDYFKNNGRFSHTVDNGKNNIYIISHNKQNVLLSNYKFGKHNAFALANIGSYYAKQMGLSMSLLNNSDFSVANRIWEGGSPQNETLYNKGSISSGEDLMNASSSEKTITFSLEYGKINQLLADAENLKSTISHEFDHIKGTDEVIALYKQVASASFKKNTTEDYRNAIHDYVRNIVFQMTTHQNNSWSKAQINELHKQAETWKKKFMKHGITF